MRMYGKITAYGTNSITFSFSVTIRVPLSGSVGLLRSGANGYQLKLTGCPMNPPGLRNLRLHDEFHGPWLSM